MISRSHSMYAARNALEILIRKLDGKRPPVRPKHKWEVNIKTDLDQIACGLDICGSG